MRISVHEGDPGHGPDPSEYDVYMDGEKLSRCHTADEETGEAWVYLDPEEVNRLGIVTHWPSRRVTGTVEIRRKA